MIARTCLLAALLLALCPAASTPASAAADSPTGQLDFDDLGLPATATVDLAMGRLELSLLAAGTAGDAATATLLAGLERVHLRQYVSPSAAVVSVAEGLPDRLQTDGWVLAQHQNQDGRHLYIYAKSHEGTFVGLAVLVIDSAHLVAIANVVGDLPPTQLGQLGLPLTP